MQDLKQRIKSVPGTQPTVRLLKRVFNVARSVPSPFLRQFPAGHFYSPLPDLEDVRRDQARIERREVSGSGVDLNAEHQCVTLGELAKFYPDLPFPEHPSHDSRYHYQNDSFRYADAIVLYGMMRRFQPKRIIEVGSGNSSAAMLDTNDACFGGRIDFTFVEPFPERLLRVLTDDERHAARILQQPVQTIDPAVFDALEENDFLFIDSSHVVKRGSDVQYLLDAVLPRLRPGVVVHFHDIPWPFEYPMAWTLSGNAWNEAYVVRAFLQYNTAFEIEYFNSYMATVHADAVRSHMPLCMKDPGGSLWLHRV